MQALQLTKFGDPGDSVRLVSTPAWAARCGSVARRSAQCSCSSAAVVSDRYRESAAFRAKRKLKACYAQGWQGPRRNRRRSREESRYLRNFLDGNVRKV